MSEEIHDKEATYTTSWGPSSPVIVEVGERWISYQSVCPHCHRLTTQVGVEVPPAYVRPPHAQASEAEKKIQFRCFEVCSHEGAPSEKTMGCGVNWWGIIEE